MEIEAFIEQDILVFLDDRLDKPRSGLAIRQRAPIVSQYISRDYEYEFFMALDSKNLESAKRVLHSLKEKFDECPNNLPEKTQLKSLLLDLYEKFKDYLDAQNTFEKIDLRLESPSNVLTPAASQPTVPQNTVKEAAPKETAREQTTPEPQPRVPTIVSPQATTQTTMEKETAVPQNIAPSIPPALHEFPAMPSTPQVSPTTIFNQQITTQLDALDALLANNDGKAAIQAYRDMKRAIATSDAALSDANALRCVELYDRIRARLQQQSQTQQSRVSAANITPSASSLSPLPALPEPTAPLNTMPQKREELLKKETTPRKEQPSQEAIIASKSPMPEPDKEILAQLELEKRKMDGCIKGNDLASAAHAYRTMRLLSQQIRDPARALSVGKKLQQIYTTIKELQRHATSPDRDLTGALP